MDDVTNPYVPGAGRAPAALVGRDEPLDRWRVALARMDAGRDARSVVLYGLRGVGKTVLLNRLRFEAEDHGWIVVTFEARAGVSLRRGIGEGLYAPLSDLVHPSPGARLVKALKTALSFKASYDASGTWNFGVDLSSVSGGGADSGDLESDLVKLVRDVGAAAQANGVGLALLIDEAQDLRSEELTAVCVAAHQISQLRLPVLFALAGLPSVPRILAEAKSYAERLFVYEPVDALSDAAAREALIDPAATEGVDWDAAAVAAVIKETAGYPYFLQQFGQDTWSAAAGPGITTSDARVGAAEARHSLDVGFFRIRWDRATATEKTYLRAMAMDDGGESNTGDVARRLRRNPNSLGPMRASLIGQKGLLYAPAHGRIAFTVPMMTDFVRRQPEE